MAPANAHELSVLPEIAEFTSGLIVGDRNYHSPKTREELAGMGVELLAPHSSKKRDPAPRKSAFLSRLRYRIDAVFSQLTERYSIKRVWARDLWQLTSRLLRRVLSHTVAFLLNHQMGHPPSQLSKLLIRKNPHIGLARREPVDLLVIQDYKAQVRADGWEARGRPLHLFTTVRQPPASPYRRRVRGLRGG